MQLLLIRTKNIKFRVSTLQIWKNRQSSHLCKMRNTVLKKETKNHTEGERERERKRSQGTTHTISHFSFIRPLSSSSSTIKWNLSPKWIPSLTPIYSIYSTNSSSSPSGNGMAAASANCFSYSCCCCTSICTSGGAKATCSTKWRFESPTNLRAK